MPSGTFKKATVVFQVVGQGSTTVEYEDGAETPEQAFYRAYSHRGSAGRRTFPRWTLTQLLRDVDDFEWVLTCSTEPLYTPGDDCPDCEGTGMVMHDDREVTCGTCEGAKVLSGVPAYEPAYEPPTVDELTPPWN